MKSKYLKSDDVAGVVVLYNSTTQVLETIATYKDQVKTLFIVDNSPVPVRETVASIIDNERVVYHSFGSNKGISVALNWAVQQAIDNGFKLLLTMDDDTTTPPDMISQLLEFLNNTNQKIGIISGIHHKKYPPGKVRLVPYTLTSGNVLNLDAVKEIGGFREDLFIDHVDHEYGLRLNEYGYKVIELTAIQLGHSLGYRREVKIGSLILLKYGTHSPIRLFYFARNGIFLIRQYSGDWAFSFMVLKELAKRLVKTILLDSDRQIRMKLLAKGLRDGWAGRLGKYQDPDDQIRLAR